MIFFYQLLLFLLTLLGLPFLTAWIYFKKCAAEGLCERLTLYPPLLKKELKSKKWHLWVHAASVGEVKLLQKIPGFYKENAIITCTSVAGRNIAMELFPKAVSVLMPVDFLILLKRLKKLIKPAKLWILETELWPGLIYNFRDLNVSLINARLTDKNFPRYYFFRNYFIKIFKWIDNVYVRDKENLIKFKRLGVSEGKLKMLGDLKYHFEIPDISEDAVFKKTLHPVIVCGSTHRGEEKILLQVFKDLKEEFGNLSLIISPRHLDRLKEIKDLFEENNIKYTRWSEKQDTVYPGEVVLVDRMGELAKIYSLSTVAFVGGSLVGAGGHNIIEPALWRVPVVIGPYFDHFKNIVETFQSKGGLKVAGDARDLYNILRQLLLSENLRKEMGEKNFAVAMEGKKQIEENLKYLL